MTRDSEPHADASEPTLALTHRVPDAEREPRIHIGPYRVLEVLGEGGMGIVYLAQQTEPIRRQVAIKVLRPRRSDPVSLHRFEAERHALARMSHPHIAQVFEAGDTPEGEPYVVMEHVPGEPVTEFCDRRRLGLDARLDLFQRICEGVHHAHQKGVLHRDLKPENLLVTEVDGRPVPKIIDFGIARALESTGTASDGSSGSALLGTPSYLPPEAILEPDRGDLDTRSDVFSLGVVLFELLIGERPLTRDGSSYRNLRQQVERERVVAPGLRLGQLDREARRRRAERCGLGSGRALLRRVRGDLDWITLRATARAREERYGSAVELRNDLERHRMHKPVVAAPTGPLYLGRKFLRRYRSGAVAALLLLVTLSAGVVARTLEARRANREAATARQTSQFLIDLFQVSDPEVTPGESVTARELLDRGAARIRRGLAAQPVPRARLMVTMGIVYRQLGLYGSAEPLLEEALALLREHLGDDEPELGEALLALGVLHWEQGHYDRAEPLLVEALELRRRQYGARNPEVAEALSHLGSLHKSQGRYPEAEANHLEALSIRQQQEDSAALADDLDDLGTLYVDWGRFELAEERLRGALEIREQQFGPEHPLVATTLNGLAIAVAQQGRDAEAEELFVRSLEIRERTLGPTHPQVAQSLNNLANIYFATGRPQAAATRLERAVDIWEARLGPENPRLGSALHNLADLYMEEGRLDRAETLFRRALAIFETSLAADHPNLAYPLHGLGQLLQRRGQPEAAESLFQRALTLRQATLEADHPALIESREHYADLLRSLGRDDEAAALEASPSPPPTPDGPR